MCFEVYMTISDRALCKRVVRFFFGRDLAAWLFDTEAIRREKIKDAFRARLSIAIHIAQEAGIDDHEISKVIDGVTHYSLSSGNQLSGKPASHDESY
jgi:hypothetical protein